DNPTVLEQLFPGREQCREKRHLALRVLHVLRKKVPAMRVAGSLVTHLLLLATGGTWVPPFGDLDTHVDAPDFDMCHDALTQDLPKMLPDGASVTPRKGVARGQLRAVSTFDVCVEG